MNGHGRRFRSMTSGQRPPAANVRGIFLAVLLCFSLPTLGCRGPATGVDKLALEELRNRAAQGDISAQRDLACAFRDGTRVQRDYREAAKWFHEAAEQGDAASQVGLGDLYEHGKGGLPENGAEAAMWYRLAAEQGYVPALYALGRIYGAGRGVSRESVQTYKWLHLAETLAISTDAAAFIARERDGVGSQMGPGDIAEARRQAQEWLKQFIRGQRPTG